MNILTKHHFITEIFLGEEYSYSFYGIDEGNKVLRIIKKQDNNIDNILKNIKNCYMLVNTNRSAQYTLFRSTFEFLGTHLNSLTNNLHEKFIAGDDSFIEDLLPLLEKQTSQNGLFLDISYKEYKEAYINKLILNNTTLNEWINDIKKELKNYKNFKFEILSSKENYPFPTKLN